MRGPIVLALCLVAAPCFARDWTLTILHTNDLHGRVEPTKVGQNLYGGYARHATLIRRFMASEPNPILLNGGDTFQGTIFFNVYEGLADLLYMNTMGYRGAAVGNHEFDRGPATLGQWVKHAQFPVMACNLDVSKEPALNGLIKAYTITQVGKERIGLIGAVTEDLPNISSIGSNVKMLDLEKSVGDAVAALTKAGVSKILLLSHCGYDVEQKLAANVKGIDVIVGGHSHSLLGTFNNPDFPKSAGPYPTALKNADGNTTLLLSSWEWGKVFGHLKVNFDDRGRVKSWSNDQPVAVDAGIPDDPLMKAHIAALVKPIEVTRKTVVGSAATPLSGSRETVRRRETVMANIVADALIEAGRHEQADFAMVSGGSIRAGIDAGPITYEEALAVQPFGNTLTVLGLTGAEVREALEYGVSRWSEDLGQFLHVSHNVRYTFDLSKPAGQRVVDVTVDGKPLEPARTYKVVMNNFMAGGGDNALVFKNASGVRINEPAYDVDVLIAYFRNHPNLSAKLEGRITILNEPGGGKG